jgi:hypothetical protein
MTRTLRPLLFSMLLFLGACASPVPPGEALQGPLPAPRAGTARFVFYRTLDYYDTMAMPSVTLNEAPTGISQNGAVFFRDVAPGRYDMALTPTLPYPHQFKTVVVKPGDLYYVRINTLPNVACTRFPAARCTEDTFIMTLVDPATGLQESHGLHLTTG